MKLEKDSFLRHIGGKNMADYELTVVIPIYNEESVIPHLIQRLNTELEKINLKYEIIFVDDCSNDNSMELIKEFNIRNPNIKILSFSRNFGHQTAITAGLNFSRGRAVVIMDGDLQDPPELIPQFIDKWKEGYEVVYGVRFDRKENIFKKIAYKLYYRLLRLLSKTEIKLDSGDFCLLDRKIVNLLNVMPEKNRFIRGLRSWVGFRQIGIRYARDKRFAGKPKYTISKLFKLGLDGIISFSGIPLKISILIGFSISIASCGYAIYIMANWIFNPQQRVPGWATLVVSVAFLGGIQLLVLGFLGEYILRIFDEVKERPAYILREVVGIDEQFGGACDNCHLRHQRKK